MPSLTCTDFSRTISATRRSLNALAGSSSTFRSLLLNKSLTVSYSRSPLHLSSRPARKQFLTPTLHTKRLSSTGTPASDPPPLEPPSDVAPPDPPAEFTSPTDSSEEPEKTKRRLKPKEIEIPLELPEGLVTEILWRPDSEPGPSNHALPPPEIFEEALHNLHITLHPQTQHRATYASSLGPIVEPTLALYCPIEGGEYVIDATVKELARRTDAEVLVLDAVHLAAGEWGVFGKPANALQLSRNPLHFRASPASNSRPFPDEEEDETDQTSAPFTPTQMTLTVLSNAAQSGRSVLASPSRRNVSPSKIQVFFETVINTQLPDDPDQKPRPRLIYIRDFPTLAPSSSAWYPPLLSSVRSRRRRGIPRSTSPITHPVTIVFGMTAPLMPKSTGLSGRSAPPYPRARMMTQSSPRLALHSRHGETEWGEDEVSERARERRLRDRLRRWATGDTLHDQLPKFSTADAEGSSDSGPGFVIIGGPAAMLAQQPNAFGESGNRDPNLDTDSVFFRTSVLVPSARSSTEEKACRVSRRREINELTMRMGVGAVGGLVEKTTAAAWSSIRDPAKTEEGEGTSDEAAPKTRSMWEDWGNRIEIWPVVRAVADRAVGHTVATRSVDGSKRSLAATPVDWSAIDKAWATHHTRRSVRRAWMKEASKSVREQDEYEDDEEEIEPEEEEVDEVVERLRNDEDLDPYEQRLLGCIVNTATMPTSFSQVHLPPHTIDSIRTIVSLPLLHPQAFQQGILKEHAMTGCLLFGPPGTGKTLVVRALARDAGCRMLAISPSDIMDMYVGEGEKLVKAVFTLARKIAPCVVFLDEIDALFGARISARDRASTFSHRGVLTEFMQEMDGLRTSKDDNVIVIGATNRPFDLDDAVLRRLPRRLLIDLPGEREREEILKILLRDETLGPDVDPASIAKKTETFSGSDLKHLCVSAALDAVKEKVVTPWSSTVPNSSGGALATEVGVNSATVTLPVSPETEPPASSDTGDEVPAPAVAPRVLHLRHFTKALKEISPSSSESLGSLADLKKWNDEFGEGKSSRKRQQVWGKGLFGFTERTNGKEDGRVVPTNNDIR